MLKVKVIRDRNLNRKTKVCIDCKKRKKIDQFPKQYQPWTKNHYSGDGRRTDCKKCHQKKNNKAYKSRTTVEERRTYMREYMRKYYKRSL